MHLRGFHPEGIVVHIVSNATSIPLSTILNTCLDIFCCSSLSSQNDDENTSDGGEEVQKINH